MLSSKNFVGESTSEMKYLVMDLSQAPVLVDILKKKKKRNGCLQFS